MCLHFFQVSKQVQENETLDVHCKMAPAGNQIASNRMAEHMGFYRVM